MMNRLMSFYLACQAFRSRLHLILALSLTVGLLPLIPGVAFADDLDQVGIDTDGDVSIDSSFYEVNDEILATFEATPGIAPAAVEIPNLCTISSCINSSKVLDVPGASVASEVRLQLWDNNSTPAQRFQFELNNDSTYTIKNINSGKVLDVRGANAFNGAVVWQYAPNGTDAQKWIVTDEGDGYKISTKVNPVYCLDVPAAYAVNTTQMQVYASNDTTAQRFSLNPIIPVLPDGAFIISSTDSSQVLDINGASSSDGTIAQFYDGNLTLAQRFLLIFDPLTGYYTIINVQSGKALDVDSASFVNGAKVQIYQQNNTYAQKWAITQTPEGSYSITAAHSGKVLSSPTRSTNNLTPVQTFDWVNASTQKWSFVESTTVNEKVYQIRSALGTVVDAYGNGKINGTLIWAYSVNGTMAQKFYLKHYSNGYFKLDCANSGLLISAFESRIILSEDRSLNNQLWKIEPIGEGQFLLLNKETNYALDVLDGSSAPGTTIHTYPLNKTPAQIWRFEDTTPLSEGLYVIQSSIDVTKVLDIANNSSANGAPLQIYEYNGSVAQVFQLINTGGQNYRITCLNSNKSLDVKDGMLQDGTVQLWTSDTNTNLNQIWQLQYYGNGNYRIYSVLGDAQYCMTLSGGSIANTTAVITSPEFFTASQFFKFIELGNIYYVPLRITTTQMVQYQRANQYISNITDQQLLDVIDPTSTMRDYAYSSHPLYRHGLFQFADLRGYTGMTANQLDAIIRAYAPANSNLFGMGYAFVQAAKMYGINECYLLAHCALESGWGTSALATSIIYDGSPIEGVTYPAGTYYNFFGIGAVDSSPFSGGASYAIRYGWDSIEKAITGGAKWIVEGYIYRNVYIDQYGQPTLYAMKWDYSRSNASLSYGWHQYATDHLWARKIARLVGDFYDSTGYRPAFTYIIPQYIE